MNLNILKKQKLPQHADERGVLSVLEFLELTFVPRRLLYVMDAPAGTIRGKHAHYINKQIVLCLKGQIDVYLWDGHKEKIFNLYPNEYVFINNLTWDEQTYITGDDVMMSIHSTRFRKEDHITSKKLFRQIIKEEERRCF